ncbi:glyoxalase [Candidatus Marinamargulisbacteria bacterium SCGC AG-343-D04]|nr:glyoxalase [Candidatus Marinamargulisbacteria bacterium SCGC AG-343-D04]
MRPFHLALPTNNLDKTKAFYVEYLGCKVGRSADTWVDLDLFGHQLVFHYCGPDKYPAYINPVDEKPVQLPHFGVVLTLEDFDELAGRLKEKSVEFIIEPYTRFKGTNGEQSTMFFLDPNGYACEFKAFKDDAYLFEPFELSNS